MRTLKIKPLTYEVTAQHKPGYSAYNTRLTARIAGNFEEKDLLLQLDKTSAKQLAKFFSDLSGRLRKRS